MAAERPVCGDPAFDQFRSTFLAGHGSARGRDSGLAPLGARAPKPTVTRGGD